jgi:hypothetical protein
MQFFTAIIALAVAGAANAASTPVHRSSPPTTLPTEPGIFTFRNDHCGYDDAQSEGDFVPYSSLDKYCTQTGLFHSYINYTPDGGPLPYDVSSDTPMCCGPAPYTHAWGYAGVHRQVDEPVPGPVDGGEADHDEHVH